jgi:hypothetical protein
MMLTKLLTGVFKLLISSFLPLYFIRSFSVLVFLLYHFAHSLLSDKSKWLGDGAMSKACNKRSQLETVCGIEEINIWETTSRICRSDGSTCSYGPFYFGVAAAIFRFSPIIAPDFFPWHEKFSLLFFFFVTQAVLATAIELQTGYKLSPPCSDTMAIECAFIKEKSW